MKGLLLHVAADTTTLGGVGPVFPDGTFEYIPIAEMYGLETRTYRAFPARNRQYGKTLADFLPSQIGELPVHFDPEFTNWTYGEPVTDYTKFRALQKLRETDILFFVASLAPFDPTIYRERDVSLWNYQRGRRNKYVIGFFTVDSITKAYIIKSVPKVTLALLNHLILLEDGKAPFDNKDLKNELETLKTYGYVNEKEGQYELSVDGLRVVVEIDTAMGMEESEDKQYELLEKGVFELESISGSTSEEIIRQNQHYKRLRPVDFDHFIVIAGKPKHSALLDHAIRLTEHPEKNTFVLTELGKRIRKRETDNFRGMRWIDGTAVRIIAEEIVKTNPEIMEKLQRLI